MLRITKVPRQESLVTLKLEGQIASDWVEELESECLRWSQSKDCLILDFSGVSYIDAQGAEMIGRLNDNLKKERLKIINCSPLVQDLLVAE